MGGESDPAVSDPIMVPKGDVFIVDTLRLSDADWYACVSEMDRASAKTRFTHERRRDERVAYRNSPYVLIVVHNYDSRKQYFKVRTYDLSRSGMSFLNGSFIHIGTHVELWMQHCDTGVTQIHATLRACNLVKGTIHRVSVEFEEPIELNDYLLAVAG